MIHGSAGMKFLRNWCVIDTPSLARIQTAASTKLMTFATLIAAMLISTWWVPDLRLTLLAGGPWLLLLAIGYFASSAARSRS